MQIDKDLKSVQEVRDLISTAKSAQIEFKHYNQEQVDKIVKAMADAAFEASEKLAMWAVEETGFGNVKDKVIKNQFSSRDVYNSIKDLKTVGIIGSEKNGKIIKIAEPMGVIAALIPSTNPTSTAIFKSLISLKCRNAIVASPHPKAVECTQETFRILTDAAEKAGAPEGLMQCMSMPTLMGTETLMKEKDIALILATGSTSMVKAAYSAGTPAYGVGSGNVPAFIERTANVAKAVADIVTGTTFDNGTLCSSEQAMIVDRDLLEQATNEARKNGCYFVNDDEKKKLENILLIDGRLNPNIVGKPAKYIADTAGFNVPNDTKVLLAHCDKVGKEEPLSVEKLSPVLAFYTVDGWLDGCHKCIELLRFGGLGHTMVIHSNDKDIILKFALEKPAFRILVNTPASVGAVGYTTALDPSMTLGVGTWGGSIISENVTAKHLMNIKTLAFETNPLNPASSVSSLDQNIKFSDRSSEGNFIEKIEERLRARAGNPKFSKGIPSKNSYSNDTDKIYGESISKSEIDEIIRRFNS